MTTDIPVADLVSRMLLFTHYLELKHLSPIQN